MTSRRARYCKNWMLILVLLCENERQRWDASRYIKARSEAQRFYVYRSYLLTFKTYNYRHCDTSKSPKTADYFPSGGVIATLLGNCKVFCYANMNVTLFRVSANQISVFSVRFNLIFVFKQIYYTIFMKKKRWTSLRNVTGNSNDVSNQAA